MAMLFLWRLRDYTQKFENASLFPIYWIIPSFAPWHTTKYSSYSHDSPFESSFFFNGLFSIITTTRDVFTKRCSICGFCPKTMVGRDIALVEFDDVYEYILHKNGKMVKWRNGTTSLRRIACSKLNPRTK